MYEIFRPGLDYTVAHSGMLLKSPLLDCNLCFAYDDEDLERNGDGGDGGDSGDSDSDSDSSSDSNSDSDSESSDDDSEEEEEEGGAISTEQDVSWEGGDVGGYECYIETQEEEAFDSLNASIEPSTESTTEPSTEPTSSSTSARKTSKKSTGEADDNELITIPANSNVLSLVLRDQQVMKFIKYINSSAPGSRFDIDMELGFE